MASLANWIFGPRVLKVDLGDRVISPHLHMTKCLDSELMFKAYKNKLDYCQEVGYIYGGRVKVFIEYSKVNNNG